MKNFNELTERLNHLFDEESDRQPMSISKAHKRLINRRKDIYEGIEQGNPEKLIVAIVDNLKHDNKLLSNISKIEWLDDSVKLTIGNNEFEISVKKV